MIIEIDLSKSLEEIEDNYWGEPEFLSSLVINCHKNRKIPLKELTPDQIRLLLGQDIGTKYLLPLALNILKENPYIECTYYPCDLLLLIVERIDLKYWIEDKILYNEFNMIIEMFNMNFEKENIERIKDLDEYDAEGEIIDDEIKEEINEKWKNVIKKMEDIM